MNRRQKLVQQQFLNNEEAVIKRLKQVYNQSLKDVNDKVKNLELQIGSLTEEYDWLDDDEPQKEIMRSRIQSKIYQKQYQEALQGQLDEVLKKMQTKQFLTVSDYLDGCYTDGFVGTVFDQHGQGVPLIKPIDQEAMVRAVQLDSKISQGLYTRLGEDVSLLKKKITAQVSRGVATGMSWKQVAKQLEGYTNVGFNRAVRIARTEGHRIQCTAAMDDMRSAKDKGDDVLKQWDATLDDVTRESHRQVDGEIRELDEEFSNHLMFAGDPAGGAAEVVNCRCAVLQRARWALDEDELQTLKDRAAYFGLDKSEEFADFEKKYLKAAEQVSEVREIKDALDFEYGNFTQDDYNKWWDNYEAHNKGVKLSAEELKVIEDYTEGGFIALNDIGRYSEAELLKKGYSATDIARMRKRADLLDGALSKYDLDTDIVTHRFERDVSWLTGKGNGIKELEDLVGKEYTAKGFTSSGMLANRFRFTGGKSDAVHFEIITPRGTNGAFLSMSKKGENEFLYNRNTRFKILDGGERTIKEGKFNFKTLQMEEIDVVERFLKVQVILDDVDDVVDVAKVATKAKAVAKAKAPTKAKQWSFTPAKTTVEAEDFIRQYVDEKGFGALGVSYTGISLDAANEVNRAISKVFTTFNIKQLGGVIAPAGNTKLGKMMSSATAAYSPIRKSLLLNRKSLKDLKTAAKHFEAEKNAIRGILEHPERYDFTKISPRMRTLIERSKVSGRSTVPDCIEDAINHELGHALEKQVLDSPKWADALANKSTFADKISGYAGDSSSEYIAESFASYMKGETVIDPVMVEIFESLMR